MDYSQFTEEQLHDLEQAHGDPSKVQHDDTLNVLHGQMVGTLGKAKEAGTDAGSIGAKALGLASKNTFDLLGNHSRALIGEGLSKLTGKPIITPEEDAASINPTNPQSAPGMGEYMKRLGVPDGLKLSDILQRPASALSGGNHPDLDALLNYGNPLTLGPIRGAIHALSGGKYGDIYAQPGQGGSMRPEVGGSLDPNVRDAAGHVLDAAADPATYLSMGETAAARVMSEEAERAMVRGNMNRTAGDKLSNLAQTVVDPKGYLTRPFSNAADMTGTRMYRNATVPLDQMAVAYKKPPISPRLMDENAWGGWGSLDQHIRDDSAQLMPKALDLSSRMDQKELAQDLLTRRSSPLAAPHTDVSFQYEPTGSPQSQASLIRPAMVQSGETEHTASLVEPYIDYGTPKSQAFAHDGQFGYQNPTVDVSTVDQGLRPTGQSVQTTPIQPGFVKTGDAMATPIGLKAQQGLTHSGWVDMNEAMNPARAQNQSLKFPMQDLVDPTQRGAHAATADMIDQYSGLGSLNRAEATKAKSRLYNTVPDNDWGAAVRTPEGAANRMAMAHGINEGVKTGSTPEIQALGDQLGKVNEQWGQNLTVQDVSRMLADREAKRPGLSQVDGILLGKLLGGEGPKDGGMFAMKKAVQIANSPSWRTGAGLALHNMGTSWMAPGLDAGLKQTFINTLNRKKENGQ